MVTDFTFGFDTAINIVTEAVDRLRTTTESHRRIMVVETMGRHAGWIACFSGIAVAADYILVPEVPIDMPHLRRRPQTPTAPRARTTASSSSPKGPSSPTAGSSPSTTSPTPSATSDSAASATPSPRQIETQTGYRNPLRRPRPPPARRPPSAYDRVLATRLGLAASHLVIQRRFGTMVALSGTQIIETPLDERVAATQTLDLTYYDEAAAFFN